MRRISLLLATMVLTVLLASGVALAQPSEKIFFGRWLYKDCPGVCTMNPDGSGSQVIKLRDDYFGTSASDAAPSPDGSKIAYVTDGHALWVSNSDGSGRIRLAKNLDMDATDPTWSPDGSKLAYASRPNKSSISVTMGGIWTINADGSGNAQLLANRYEYDSARGQYHSVHHAAPDWSPNGSRIAFVRSESWEGYNNISNVYTVNTDGSRLTNLTAGSNYSTGNLDWSPDGNKIAFVSSIPDTRERYYGQSIFVMNADGSGRTPLTNTVGLPISSSATPPMDSEPHWSPDGNKIAFHHTNDWESSPDIRTMNANGSGQTAITATGDHTLFGWGLHELPDTARPTVSGMRPKPGSATSDRTPTISATVKDHATELSGEDITLYVAGSKVTTFAYDSATDKLTYTPPRLAKGKKTVKIEATDAAGNLGTKSWYFTIK